MFDQMKQMGALAGLLKNKERMQEIGEEAQARIAEVHVEGRAGGGAVRVEMSGKMQVTAVHLEPALIHGLKADETDASQTMAEALIADATNEALQRAQLKIREVLQQLARDYELPDMPGMDKLLGGGV